MIHIKRAYEKAERDDGYRILIDRLWPRGISKNKLKMDEWIKDIAPSSELRKKFAHDPERWKEFKSAYLKELRSPELNTSIRHLLELAKKSDLTLLYSAHDEKHNNAIVLKQFMERKLKKNRD